MGTVWLNLSRQVVDFEITFELFSDYGHKVISLFSIWKENRINERRKCFRNLTCLVWYNLFRFYMLIKLNFLS